ncbi:MAG TPA: molecular chaperone DnaK, partial [Dongiaceae bacterium]|nr:molecular chaperone DnaK [Dongiaceae bacterium]
VAAADKSAVEAAIADLKGVKDQDDPAAIEAKTNALTQAMMKIGEALYRASQAEGPNAAGGATDGTTGQDAGAQQGAGGSDEKVVDADFEEVDERKGKTA